jgi:integrase
MLLSESIEAFTRSMVGVLAPASVTFYRRRLPSLLSMGDFELSEITLEMLRAWRAGLASRSTRWGGRSSHPATSGGLAAHTLHQYVRAARRLFKWLELEGIISTNPSKRLELPVLPKQYRRGITLPDRDRILAAARSSPRDYAIVLFFADTACRRAGLAGLRLEDLDLENCRAVLREKGRGGSGKQRVVFYLEPTRDAIKAYLSERQADHEYVFCGARGPLTPGGVYEIFRRLARAAGVRRGWNPHNWRHASIRGMLARGMSLPAVIQIAGHASVQTTGDLYGVFSEEELAQMHARCSWLAAASPGQVIKEPVKAVGHVQPDQRRKRPRRQHQRPIVARQRRQAHGIVQHQPNDVKHQH